MCYLVLDWAYLGGEIQIDAINSNFENLKSAVYMKSVTMPFKFISHASCVYVPGYVPAFWNTFSQISV